jgi:hypothetical protein
LVLGSFHIVFVSIIIADHCGGYTTALCGSSEGFEGHHNLRFVIIVVIRNS